MAEWKGLIFKIQKWNLVAHADCVNAELDEGNLKNA